MQTSANARGLPDDGAVLARPANQRPVHVEEHRRHARWFRGPVKSLFAVCDGAPGTPGSAVTRRCRRIGRCSLAGVDWLASLRGGRDMVDVGLGVGVFDPDTDVDLPEFVGVADGEVDDFLEGGLLLQVERERIA